MKSCKPVNVSKLTTFAAFVVLLLMCTDSTKCEESDKATSDEQPPLVFPEDSSKYKIIPSNDTIFISLTHPHAAGNNSEIYDMLHAPLAEETLRNADVPEEKKKVEPEKSDPSLKVLGLGTNADFQSELIQDSDAIVEKDSFALHSLHKHTGIWAAVTLSIILVASGLIYLGLFLWRKILIAKYGRRQILINEEDPTSDFKHSEL